MRVELDAQEWAFVSAGMQSIWKKYGELNQNNQKFHRQNEEWRNSRGCSMEAGGVGVEGMMTLTEVGVHL